MGSVPEDPATDRPREWLALPGGGIRPVVSVPGPGGIAELLAYGAWLARLRPACRCGRSRLGSGRTCGSAECVAELRVFVAGYGPRRVLPSFPTRRSSGLPSRRPCLS